jgi:hypothetical protein
MKKIIPILIIVILLIVVVYVVIGDLKEVQITNVVDDNIIEDNVDPVISYVNLYYNFSLNTPQGLEYCLSDMCLDNNAVLDKNVNFKIDDHQFLKYLDIEMDNNKVINSLLEIKIRKSLLDVSIVNFTKRSIELNRKYSKNHKDAYSQEEIITFLGEDAYTFIAKRGFEERGLSYSEEMEIFLKDDESDSIQRAGEGILLTELHRVIYFNHNGFMYRIIYPIENKVAVDIVDSFKFID